MHYFFQAKLHCSFLNVRMNKLKLVQCASFRVHNIPVLRSCPGDTHPSVEGGSRGSSGVPQSRTMYLLVIGIALWNLIVSSIAVMVSDFEVVGVYARLSVAYHE